MYPLNSITILKIDDWYKTITKNCFHFLITSVNFIQKIMRIRCAVFEKWAKIGHFGPKLAIFYQKLAKMAKFRVFLKIKHFLGSSPPMVTPSIDWKNSTSLEHLLGPFLIILLDPFLTKKNKPNSDTFLGQKGSRFGTFLFCSILQRQKGQGTVPIRSRERF